MAQNVTVSGTVVDDGGEPLPSVIIKRFATGHKMRGYASSDSRGDFIIEAAVGDTLEFSMLGFESQTVAVSDGISPLKVKMLSSSIELKEVTVNADKIREKGDTVTYLVGAFANGNDRSIGDVIAKMPGFDVDKVSGRISYEGRPISKFYIEGLDMLGGKYGVATNTLPQGEVGAVQVMRNHQPIRVLDDFTFSDDAAVNIRMKDRAKSHWVTSWRGGLGIGASPEPADNGSAGYQTGSGNELRWKLEGFGLRLKSDIQAMITYKTNNTGEDISRESSNLFDISALSSLQPRDFIQLSSPSVSGLSASRSLINRSHALTANFLKRIDDDSQINLQLTYNNDRGKAWGGRTTEYYRTGGNRIIDNRKSWRDNDNELYALLKYEHNSTGSYLRNSLSGDMRWLSQHLDETGTDPHHPHTRLPVFDFRDNLYIIRRYGKTLVSFYSNNTLQNRPQHLFVDSLVSQSVAQRFYATDTYAMGGMKLGRFSLSARLGVDGLLRYMDAAAYGLPDSIGNASDKSHFGYARLYVRPQVEYSTNEIGVTLSVPIENTYYKYSADGGRNRFDVSPLLNFRWNITSRLRMSLRGGYSVEPADFNRFYGSLIMQDYMYLNRGYSGYDVTTSKSVTYNLVYRNSLRGTHVIASVTRSFDTNPYTLSRTFVGDYVIIGTTAVETHSNRWNANLMCQQGLPFLSGKITLRGIYSHDNSKMFQDGALTSSEYNALNTTASLFLSPFKDMTLDYSLRYSYNDMRLSHGSTTSFNAWRHTVTAVLPVGHFKLKANCEYNHNQIAEDSYKDAFFADAAIGYSARHFDIDFGMNNLLNKKTYARSTASELMTVRSESILRGRECLVTISYKP